MKKIAMLALTAVLALGILAGCSGGNANAIPMTVTMGPGGEMKFDPDTYSFEKGKTYTVTLKNADTAQPHSFLIPALNVKSAQIPAGKDATVTVTANKEGTYEVLCDVPGHKDGGMKGTANVK